MSEKARGGTRREKVREIGAKRRKGEKRKENGKGEEEEEGM